METSNYIIVRFNNGRFGIKYDIKDSTGEVRQQVFQDIKQNNWYSEEGVKRYCMLKPKKALYLYDSLNRDKSSLKYNEVTRDELVQAVKDASWKERIKKVFK